MQFFVRIYLFLTKDCKKIGKRHLSIALSSDTKHNLYAKLFIIIHHKLNNIKFIGGISQLLDEPGAVRILSLFCHLLIQ